MLWCHVIQVRDRHIVHKLLNVLQEELSSASTGRPHSHSQQQQQQEHHQYHGEDSSNSRRRPGHRAARSRHARDGKQLSPPITGQPKHVGVVFARMAGTAGSPFVCIIGV